jgi:hypothetical protein
MSHSTEHHVAILIHILMYYIVLLSQSYKVELKLTVWGYINKDYCTDNERKKQLDAVLLPYNLTATAHFPTRVQN